jgi:hypothetical protein
LTLLVVPAVYVMWRGLFLRRGHAAVPATNERP